MGKKKWAYKTSKYKSSPPPRDEETKDLTAGEQSANQPSPLEEPPRNPTTRWPPVNQPPPPPTLQPGTMISVEALNAFLQTTIPGVNCEAALEGLTQVMGAASTVSGTPTVLIPPSTVSASEIPSTTAPDSVIPIPTEPSQKTSVPPETPIPSPKPNQDKPLDVSPLSAYQDLGKEAESTEGERPKKGEGGAEGAEKEGTPIAETPARRKATEKVDLNEMAKKQGLMTDEEFQTILDGAREAEESAAKMAEGSDLASEAVRSKSPAEPTKVPEEAPPEPVVKAEP